MNLQFKSDLKGGELFKKAILFLVGFIVAMIAFAVVAESAPAAAVVLYLLVLVGAFALDYVFLSTLVSAVSFNDEQFSWQGTFGKFMLVNLKGIFLSCLTLGIYAPWYTKNLTDYLAESIKYPGRDITFNGKATKLLKYVFLSFIIPLAVVVAIFMGIITSDPTNTGLVVVGFIIYIVGLFATCSFYYFFVYKWWINFTFGEDAVTLVADFKETVQFLLVQFLLIIVTFGIYTFAAEVKIFGYFTDRVVFTGPTGVGRNLRFNGDTKEGFFLLLGQTLLCMITFGIYMPWAYANIQNWFISNVELAEA